MYKGLKIQTHHSVHEFVASYATMNLNINDNILDLATGYGSLAKRLLDLGFKNTAATSWNGKCNLNIPIYEINLDNPFNASDLGGNKYQMICAIDVIEHLENPTLLLKQCKELLDEKGKLIISTPNLEYVPYRLQWLIHGCPTVYNQEEVEKNRHISMIWRQGLEYLIHCVGFDIIEKKLIGDVSLEKSLFNLLKKTIIKISELCLNGETRGAIRVYILEKHEFSNSMLKDPRTFY